VLVINLRMLISGRASESPSPASALEASRFGTTFQLPPYEGEVKNKLSLPNG
jgi:hypothetical protein